MLILPRRVTLSALWPLEGLDEPGVELYMDAGVVLKYLGLPGQLEVKVSFVTLRDCQPRTVLYLDLTGPSSGQALEFSPVPIPDKRIELSMEIGVVVFLFWG